MADLDAISRLTSRERDCLTLVARGFTSGEIAGELALSESRVNNLILSARAKLGNPSRKVAARMVAAATVVEAPDAAGQKLPGHNMPGANQPGPMHPVSRPMPASPPSIVQEERQAFILEPSPEQEAGSSHDRIARPIYVVAAVALIAFCLVVLLLAIDPLAQSAGRLANILQPYRQ